MIEPDRFEDSRGFFMETYHSRKYAEGGLDRAYVQDNYSHSSQGTLRGLHYQFRHPQEKLVYVITGEIFDVAVDIRPNSPAFGKWMGTHLSADNKFQVFIPEGFAHGFYVLSERADVVYKCTDFYAPDEEGGILWSDPEIDIEWPVSDPLLSAKDSQYPCLKEVPPERLPGYEDRAR